MSDDNKSQRKGIEQAREARRRAEEDYAELVAGRSEVKDVAAQAAEFQRYDIAELVMLAFGRG